MEMPLYNDNVTISKTPRIDGVEIEVRYSAGSRTHVYSVIVSPPMLFEYMIGISYKDKITRVERRLLKMANGWKIDYRKNKSILEDEE